tara:strand:+ start:70 stop:486 length:417 start_codon:yes stop_codon:yes gene_type:complete
MDQIKQITNDDYKAFYGVQVFELNDYYKSDEIKQYFNDFIEEQDTEWIEENIEQNAVHNQAFNMEPYIIGTYKAKQWLGDHAFDIIATVKDYELETFGELYTDLSNPEKVVNMYAYIVGELVVHEWTRNHIINKEHNS